MARSDSRLKEVELLGKDLMDPQNGGSHPWSVQDGTQSTLLLFNTSNAPQYFNVVIGSGGILWQRSYQLQPLQTKAISINGLIDNQVKDDKGRVLPKDIWSGQVDWYLANLNTGRGRLLQSNRDTAMARNFSCGVTIELCEADFISYVTSIITGDIGNLGEIAAQVCMNTCYGTPSGSGCDGCTYGWNSEDTSIASISGSSSDQSVSLLGVTPGITYIDGYVSGMQCYVQLNPSPPANVISITQSPSTINMSSGDTKTLSVSVTPSSVASQTVFSYGMTSQGTQSQIISASTATISFAPPQTFTGNDTWSISVSGTNSPSGIFNATACSLGSCSQQSSTVSIPPQVIIQVLDGEAGGQARGGDAVSEPAIGSSMLNRILNPSFGSPATWQAVIQAPNQYGGYNSTTQAITTGIEPELDNAVALYSGSVGDIVGGSPCFFSPTGTGWSSIQGAYTSGTSTVPSTAGDPDCYGSNRQLVWKVSVGNNTNGNGAPAFIFERQKVNQTDTAVVQIP